MRLVEGTLLYHGSYAAITQINLDQCAAGKDFGKGFYLTDDRQLMPDRLKLQYCFLSKRALRCLEPVEVIRYEQ